MKVLLSDGSGVTSRQLATILSQKGHQVDVLCPSGLTLTKLTRCVTKTHQVPSFGPDPYKWLDVALEIIREDHFDVLVCAQEQVAVLSAEVHRVRELGVRIAVPDFNALSRVMDKVSACETLHKVGILQPETVVVGSVKELLSHVELVPAYVKTPIGTSSAGVQFAKSAQELAQIAVHHERGAAFERGGKLLLQKAISGQVVMVTAVFQDGHLLAWHACLKVRDGPSGGAAKKCSLSLPFIGENLRRLGQELKWDGGLSLDAIYVAAEQKAYYIDVNPRIVEPTNALLSGADLVECLLQISHAGKPVEIPRSTTAESGNAGICSHQAFLTLLKAAEGGRLGVVTEASKALFGWGEYYNSQEELTPMENDWLSAISISFMACLLLVFGRQFAERLGRSNTSRYALSATGWDNIKQRHGNS